eukprot:5654979-Amphidinium_carterae.1
MHAKFASQPARQQENVQNTTGSTCRECERLTAKHDFLGAKQNNQMENGRKTFCPWHPSKAMSNLKQYKSEIQI